jgi:carbonic anhydrase
MRLFLRLALWSFVLVGLSAASCQSPTPQSDKPKPPDPACKDTDSIACAKEHAERHWGYDSQVIIPPRDWWTIAGNEACQENRTDGRQSPIDISFKNGAWVSEENLKALSWRYDANSKFKIFHNRHAVQATLNSGQNTIAFQGNTYKLLQFHYHIPSEHVIDGQRKFLEYHFVHQNINPPHDYAVVGVMMEQTNNASEESQNIAQEILKLITAFEESEKDLDGLTDLSLNPAGFLPQNRSYATYQGSLTTPPCTESVTWILLKEPVKLLSTRISEVKSYISTGFENARPTQAITTKHDLKFINK